MARTFICIVALAMLACVSAAPTGKAIATSAIPATPAAAACKKNLDAAATQFAAGGIDKVTQIAGANTTNYIFCMEYKPTAKDTATIPVHVEPTFTKTPFSKLLTNPANPQVSGFVDAVYAAAAETKANGDYGLATYPWDLANKSSAAPKFQKTALVERLSSATSTYMCGCGIATDPMARRMLH